jgi:hypothetical protein
MAVRLSALRAGRPLPPGRSMVLISVRGPAMEGLGQLKKKSKTSSGIEHATFRFFSLKTTNTMSNARQLQSPSALLTSVRHISCWQPYGRKLLSMPVRISDLLSAKVGANFADKRRSLGRCSSLRPRSFVWHEYRQYAENRT